MRVWRMHCVSTCQERQRAGSLLTQQLLQNGEQMNSQGNQVIQKGNQDHHSHRRPKK